LSTHIWCRPRYRTTPSFTADNRTTWRILRSPLVLHPLGDLISPPLYPPLYSANPDCTGNMPLMMDRDAKARYAFRWAEKRYELASLTAPRSKSMRPGIDAPASPSWHCAAPETTAWRACSRYHPHEHNASWWRYPCVRRSFGPAAAAVGHPSRSN